MLRFLWRGLCGLFVAALAAGYAWLEAEWGGVLIGLSALAGGALGFWLGRFIGPTDVFT
ncbi:MAG: hypothetical protein ACO4CW_06285 [Planctomycetota bacterium]|jgi:zinc transporter ZupT